MPETSPTLSLPYLQPAQAQKHVTHNEALRILDAVTQLSVLNATLATPPALPEVGDRYIVPVGATDAWAGQDTALALWTDNTWQFFVPGIGWRADVAGSGETLRFDGSDWVVPAAAVPDLDNVTQVGIGTTADGTNRLAVSSAATLLNHAGAGHQVKVNKSIVTDTASLLFQTGFSGRAEMGTAGGDDFAIKVSADGSTFVHGIAVSADTGFVTIGEGTGGSDLSVVGPLAPTIQVANTGGAGGASFRMTDAASGGDWKFKITGSGGFKLRDQTAGLDMLTIDSTAYTISCAGPVVMPAYTVATLPSASVAGAGAQIYVSDETGGAVPAFSDGSNWRRVTDRAVVS